MDRAGEGSTGGDLPWASVFDPAANMRAFSTIQADGFRAASELVDRFVRMTSAGLQNLDREAPARTAPGAGGHSSDVFGATGLEPVVNSLWSMFDQFLRTGAPRGDQPAPPTDTALAAFDLAEGRAMGRLELVALIDRPPNAEVWLHNGGPVDLGKVRLRCSDLLSHGGHVVRADELRFDPDVVPMPGRSSRGVTVACDGGARPGAYRGTLLVDGHPDLWLPVELTVAELT